MSKKEIIQSSWKGIEYIKSAPAKVHDPKTPSQLRQRSKLGITMAFIKTINPVIRIGYQNYKEGRTTAINAATSYIMNNAFTTKGVDLKTSELDYSKIQISRGKLLRAEITKATIEAGKEPNTHKMFIEWDATLRGKAKANDIAMIVAHNSSRESSTYSTNAGSRHAGKAELPLPKSREGDVLHIYLAFRSREGKEVSDSGYVLRTYFSRIIVK